VNSKRFFASLVHILAVCFTPSHVTPFAFPQMLLPPTCLLRSNSCLVAQRHLQKSDKQPSSPTTTFSFFCSPLLSQVKAPKLLLKLPTPPRSHTNNPPALLQGPLASYSPAHAPPLSFALFLRGFSQGDTQPRKPPPPPRPPTQGPCSSPESRL